MSCNELGLALGQIISRTRIEQGKTQQEVADGIGVKRETVNQWETGTRQLKAEHIIKLSKFFNVSADYILGLRDTQSSDPTLQSAVDYTGLSEYAVEALRPLARCFIPYSTDTLNLLLSSEQFPHLLSDLSTFFFGRSVEIDTKTLVGTEAVDETVSVALDWPEFSEWLKEIIEPAMLPRINQILYEIKAEK